jgi:hypothetical protein
MRLFVKALAGMLIVAGYFVMALLHWRDPREWRAARVRKSLPGILYLLITFGYVIELWVTPSVEPRRNAPNDALAARHALLEKSGGGVA